MADDGIAQRDSSLEGFELLARFVWLRSDSPLNYLLNFVQVERLGDISEGALVD